MAREHHHPDERLIRPMTEMQRDLLRRVIATNGGGLSVYAEPDRLVDALVRRHFIQGKAGSPGRFVHTRLGLEEMRKLEAEPPSHD